MKRSKLYYPKSSILNAQYTSGKEYMTEDGTEYVGYYHKYDTGEIFTESEWDRNKSKKLVPYIDISNYPQLQNASASKITAFLKSDVNLKNYKTPISNFNLPTQSDYDRGFYFRYFSIKRNEPTKIQEISKNDFLRYGEVGGINQFLYKVDKIKWHLIGDEYDTVGNNGIVLKRGVVNNNLREVLALKYFYPYIETVFGDYRQFTQYSRFNRL